MPKTSKTLSDFTSRELYDELDRRRKEEEARVEQAKTELAQGIGKHLLYPFIIDVLCPKHLRTSCNDESPRNIQGVQPCPRCIFLHAYKSQYWDRELQLSVAVYREDKPYCREDFFNAD